MAKKVTNEDLELLGELGVETEEVHAGGQSAQDQRIIAGFEEIERFIQQHGRPPEHGESRDIFERIYAVRLDRIRQSEECLSVLKGLDHHGLLSAEKLRPITAVKEALSDEELLAELGVEASPKAHVTELVHVRPRDEIKAAEEIAQRHPCPDFKRFRPIFELVQKELTAGKRETIKFADNAEVRKGDLFILDGQKVMIADMEEPYVNDYGRTDCRLRVVYDNGTESDLLVRSLQRSLNKDKASRRITTSDWGPLFSEVMEEGDLASGCIYVLRSKSEHPFIAQHRDVVHKIGLTGGDVKNRVGNAKKETTYLLADVDIVMTFMLANIKSRKLESLIHNFFAPARLDLELKDRFGFEVEPREWFLVPLPIIEEAIQRIMNGTISNCRYDPKAARIIVNL